MTATSEFLDQLESLVGKKLAIRINNNRSTLLSVKWEPAVTRVSLHQMFLDAPELVQTGLVSYLRRDTKRLSPHVKAFIEENSSRIDYSHLKAPENIITQGEAYDLEPLYKKLNLLYFNGKLKLAITWYGEHRPKSRRKCTLGQYYNGPRLIRMHRMLDNPKIPQFVVEYVIYHEMVHAVCPPYVDARGVNRMHHKEFKRQEALFSEFKEACKWLKEHQNNYFFRGFFSHGWTQQMGKYKAQKRQGRRKKRQSIFSYF